METTETKEVEVKVESSGTNIGAVLEEIARTQDKFHSSFSVSININLGITLPNHTIC
ncbi:MAG: hypothetical protein HQK96_06130 [Nitrospirae bacterium]|nr:hypothetical protein [Nitrospirota bacterium]